MQFDYEIPAAEYAAALMLYYRANGKGRLFKRALGWVLLGLFFVLIAVSRWVVDWGPILLLLTGTWLIYGGIASLFPTRYYRRVYPESGLVGKKYHAELDENGFSVTGDACSWRRSGAKPLHAKRSGDGAACRFVLLKRGALS